MIHNWQEPLKTDPVWNDGEHYIDYDEWCDPVLVGEIYEV